MKLILLNIFFSLSTILAQSESVIQGLVVDNDTNAPAIGATISVLDTNIDARTNIDGEFRIKLPSNTWLLKVDFIGFQPNFILVHDTIDIFYNIKMKPNTPIFEGIPMYSAEEQLRLIEYTHEGKRKASSDIEIGKYRLLQNKNVSEVQKYVSDKYLFRFEKDSVVHSNFRSAYNQAMLSYFEENWEPRLFADLEFINWNNE